VIFHTCDRQERSLSSHVLCVLRAHDVTDVSSCLFWIVGEKEPARPHNKIKKVNKQAAFTLMQSNYILLTVPACAASFRVTVKRANQR